MKSATSTKLPNGHGSLYKEVRFSPTATPIRRSHSVPDSHPTLRSEHMKKLDLQKESFPSPAITYLEQSRSLLDRQRLNFDRERALFAEERHLWEKERELLKSRISELEALLKSRGIATAPRSHSYSHPHSQVWEGSSPASRPTRVFADDAITEKPDSTAIATTRLPSVPEQGGNSTLAPPSLDAALSPKSHPADFHPSIPVPIEKLDSRLDGITLKSSALPPEVVARVMTPPSPSSRENSPPSSGSASQQKTPGEHRNSLKLKLSDLGPPEINLVRDAGHTPMAVIDRDEAEDTDLTSPHQVEEGPSLECEKPLAPPATSFRQPTEREGSYFAGVTDLPDDPALQGPLSLVNEKEHDDGFLQEVDQKLLDQARGILGWGSLPNDDEEEEREEAGDETQAEPETGTEPTSRGEPEIKFRNTTNFGTAFGQSL